MLKQKLLILLLFGSISFCFCQGNFTIKNNQKSTKIKFDLVNNLIIVPVELNGQKLSFLVDTGVKTTVLLNLDQKDSLLFNSAEKINLRGLGGEELIEAYRVRNNDLQIGNLRNSNLTIFIIYDEKINFSPRLGVPVHGIIGYDLFKEFIVEINYPRKFLRVHDPLRFDKNLKRYEELPLKFFQDKPYIKTLLNIEGSETEATLLLDNGLSDALWLFPNDDKIFVPQQAFPDFLGLGLLGDVLGKRSRIQSIKIGSRVLENVTAAFPDSLSVEGLQTYHERNGSIGSESMRRFHLIFDYNNEKLYLRGNKWFKEPFYYNMSGIVLEHSGFIVVESYEKVLNPVTTTSGEDNLLIIEPSFYKKFQLKPAFRIARIREDSPADLAGLQEGDEVLKVNGRNAFKFGLDDFTSLFASEEGKKITMEVLRIDQKLNFTFRLKDPAKN